MITTEGERLLTKIEKYERWEKLGVEQIEADLKSSGGVKVAGVGMPEETQMAWDWVRIKRGQAMLPTGGKRAGSNGASSFIANSRIDELRQLTSPDFDFQKLVRLCEELNSSYDSGNYYATAMLTRGLLDHIPPLFGFPTFKEVANNYSGGGRWFKGTMQHLDGAIRKISDGHLHVAIRRSETLPTPQQVYCGPELDALLGEIVRITR